MSGKRLAAIEPAVRMMSRASRPSRDVARLPAGGRAAKKLYKCAVFSVASGIVGEASMTNGMTAKSACAAFAPDSSSSETLPAMSGGSVSSREGCRAFSAPRSSRFPCASNSVYCVSS